MVMRAAILDEDSKVANIVLVNQLADVPGSIAGDAAHIGDLWNGSAFIKQTPAVHVPHEVPMVEALHVLLDAEITEAMILAKIDLLASPVKEQALIDFTRRPTVRRDSPWVELLAPEFGLSEANVDQLFILAEQRTAT